MLRNKTYNRANKTIPNNNGKRCSSLNVLIPILEKVENSRKLKRTNYPEFSNDNSEEHSQIYDKEKYAKTKNQ